MITLLVNACAEVTEQFACRTLATEIDWIEVKFTRGNYVGFLVLLSILMPLTVFSLLVSEFWVSGTELIIGDVTIDFVLMQVLHVGFISKSGIGGDDDASFIDVVADL